MKPTSKWMPFPKLISLLSAVLALPAMDVIKKHHGEYMVIRHANLFCHLYYYAFICFFLGGCMIDVVLFNWCFWLQNGRMSRECLVRRVRAIAGDKLLVAAIRAYRSKARGKINNPWYEILVFIFFLYIICWKDAVEKVRTVKANAKLVLCLICYAAARRKAVKNKLFCA